MTVKNLAASVHGRLANNARATKRPFQELLQYYAMERFLYRLAQTPHRERFVLKGALMLYVWSAPLARATKDLDFLARMDNSLETMERVVEGVPQEAPKRRSSRYPLGDRAASSRVLASRRTSLRC